MLVSGKTAEESGNFLVSLKASLWKNRESLCCKLFSLTGTDNYETNLAACFLLACFELGNARTSNDDNETVSDNEDDDHRGKLFIRHRFKDLNLRRTIIEFGMCFLSGSISGGCLRSKDSVPIALMMSQELSIFSMSVHDSPTMLKESRRKLLMASYSAEEILPSVSRL